MGFNIKEYFKKYFGKNSAFFRGMGSLNIWGYYSKPPWMKDGLTHSEQDAMAIRGDWEKVGEDLRISMDNFKKSLSNKLKD